MAIFARVLVALSILITVACLGLASSQAQDLKFNGAITQKDAKDTKTGDPCHVHVVKMKAGETYTIYLATMNEGANQSYFRLEDTAGKEISELAGAVGAPDLQFVFKCPRDGDYRVICTFGPKVNTKNYQLSVTRNTLSASVARSMLYGKPAPDLQGDFVLNSKTGKLSDLKGKVVLLNFWAVQSASSVVNLPRLNDWHQAYKNSGFAVVGVTYYNSERGHKLGFDPAAGKLQIVDSANSETDQAMLKVFADHHKLEYALFMMHQANALKTYNDYLVNGLPQIVLIDRNGILRSIFAGDAQVRSPDIEVAIKQLLAER